MTGTLFISRAREEGLMAPGNIDKNIDRARASTVTKPVVRSATATGKLATSLRRLGADDSTVQRLTGVRRPATG